MPWRPILPLQWLVRQPGRSSGQCWTVQRRARDPCIDEDMGFWHRVAFLLCQLVTSLYLGRNRIAFTLVFSGNAHIACRDLARCMWGVWCRGLTRGGAIWYVRRRYAFPPA